MFLYKQINLKDNVEIGNSLKVIYGLGDFKSRYISVKLGLGYPYSINNLNFYMYQVLFIILENLTWLEVRIKHIILENIKNLMLINSYRGLRHRDHLPCNGQRTRTNARSCKRNKLQ